MVREIRAVRVKLMVANNLIGLQLKEKHTNRTIIDIMMMSKI